MKILTVIPIAKGINKDTLTYFSANTTPRGSVVSVPLRNKKIPALVIEEREAEELKTNLRTADFTLKKVSGLISDHVLPHTFIECVDDYAHYAASTPGAIMYSLAPKMLFEQAKKITTCEIANPHIRAAEKFVLQSEDTERYANYRSLIREEFARGYSVFICLPTLEDIENVREALEKGVEKYTFVLNGSLTPKQLVTTVNSIYAEKHPIVVIATGSFLCLNRKDFGTIIIEEESSKNYKGIYRPFVDVRVFAELYAKKINARLIFADSALRIETVWRYKNNELHEFGPMKFRSLCLAEQTVVDMVKSEKDSDGNFTFVSPELELLIKNNKENNEHAFFFASRKGLAPTTVCSDCGTVSMCRVCSTPIILHKGAKGNYYLCPRCGEKRAPEDTCAHCGSWRLESLGIGIERVEEELQRRFPDLNIIRFDKESVPTRKRALEKINKFYSSPGSVLLGTEMALSYLHKPIDNAAIVSIDSLFSIPDFRIQEKIFHILLKMRSLAQKTFLIQTRSASQKIFDYAIKGNLIDFYREEIEERKQFEYPPFSTFIKLTLQGEKSAVQKRMKELQESMGDYETVIFPAFVSVIKGRYVMNGLIKLPHGNWPDMKLLEKLNNLPPHFMIKVDPESVL